MMITADQLVCHAIGDYILQSDWMATEKTKRSIAALAHVLTYMLPFLFLRPSPLALFVIVSTHFVIDRWRLARIVVWAKNFIAPIGWDEACYDWDGQEQKKTPRRNWRWEQCKNTSGYPPNRPAWLAVWLLIIADNIMHVVINGIALAYL